MQERPSFSGGFVITPVSFSFYSLLFFSVYSFIFLLFLSTIKKILFLIQDSKQICVISVCRYISILYFCRLFSDVSFPPLSNKPVLKFPSKLKEFVRAAKDEVESRIKSDQKLVSCFFFFTSV